MNRIRACPPRGFQNYIATQVRFSRRRWTKQVCLIRLENVERTAVGLRVNSNRTDSELFASPIDAKRNLTPIGYKNFSEGRQGIVNLQEIVLSA